MQAKAKEMPDVSSNSSILVGVWYTVYDIQRNQIAWDHIASNSSIRHIVKLGFMDMGQDFCMKVVTVKLQQA